MSVRGRVNASLERSIVAVSDPRERTEDTPVTEPCRDLLGGAWP